MYGDTYWYILTKTLPLNSSVICVFRNHHLIYNNYIPAEVLK